MPLSEVRTWSWGAFGWPFYFRPSKIRRATLRDATASFPMLYKQNVWTHPALPPFAIFAHTKSGAPGQRRAVEQQVTNQVVDMGLLTQTPEPAGGYIRR